MHYIVYVPAPETQAQKLLSGFVVPNSRCSTSAMSCCGCKKHFFEYCVLSCRCHWCSSCYKAKHDEFSAAKSNSSDVDLQPMRWSCPHCKYVIDDFTNYQLIAKDSPVLRAQYKREHGTKIEKKRAKKDKSNRKLTERRRQRALRAKLALTATQASQASSSGSNQQ